MLLLCTGQRRSDVVRMGWQHIREGVFSIRQEKTGQTVTMPIAPALQDALAELPRDRLTFLATAQGRAFSPAGFTNWFRDCIESAGLPAGSQGGERGLSPHRLRKATARRLAEAGCTPYEIASITGHTTLAEVARYASRANRRQLAKRAMERFGQTGA